MCDHTTLPPSTRPAPGPPRLCARSLPGRLDQIGEARALTARMLHGCPATDDALLLISELATNACIHTASGHPGGTFTVRIRTSPHLIHAEVEDQGSTWDGNIGTAQPPHGLFLLRVLSTTCGTRPGAGGWITWFSITCTQATARTPPS
jgi:Histidine kinase-like ATPase domain